MQNLVVVSHAVCAHVGDLKNLGDARAPPFGTGSVADAVEIRPPQHCHLARCGRSKSNGTRVITEIHRKNLTPLHSAFQGHSRSSMDADLSATYDFLSVVLCNYKPI